MVMNIKSFVVLTILFALLFVSCNQSSDTLFDFVASDTIKFATDKNLENIQWTDEINGEIIRDANASINQETKFFQKPGLVYGEKNEKIYPSYKGLGSLDVSEIPTEIYKNIGQFLESMKTTTVSETFFVQNRAYLAVIALYEITQMPPITKWIIVKPYIADNSKDPLFEVPVRLITDTGYRDISLFLVNIESNSLQIEQIVYGDFIGE